jgi:hypothetical protein
MTPSAWAVVFGAITGLAILALVVAFLRPAPVDLASAIARLDAWTLDGQDQDLRWRDRVVGRLVASSARSTNRWWGIPARELDLTDLSPARYVLHRLTWAAGGAGLIVGCWVMTLTVGLDIPAFLVVLVSVVAAVAGSMVPPLAAREDAEIAREEFRRTIAAYLDLVAQERATGRAPTQALQEAANVADSWVLARIRTALAHAFHIGITPWEAMTRLAREVEVPELGDLADIVSTAADGAAVYATLTAQASSLRTAALTKDKADANTRSEQLELPVTLLLLGFLVLVIYPAVIRLFTS